MKLKNLIQLFNKWSEDVVRLESSKHINYFIDTQKDSLNYFKIFRKVLKMLLIKIKTRTKQEDSFTIIQNKRFSNKCTPD